MIVAAPLIHFENPHYLALLGLVPMVALASRRSLAGLGPIRYALCLAVRCIVVALLVLALAGFERVRRNNDQTVCILLDRSSSIPQALLAEARQFIRAASEQMRPGQDRVALIAFDGAPSIEQLPSLKLRAEFSGVGNFPHQTNIAAAMRTAMAVFPSGAARRILLLTDGNENVGDALGEADFIATARLPIDVTPLAYEHDREIIVERLGAPAIVRREETVNLQVAIRAQSPASGRILIEHNGALLDLDPSPHHAGQAITLDAGPNRLTVPVPVRETGAHRFRAIFQPDEPGDDSNPRNNDAGAVTIVAGEERVLILAEARAPEDMAAAATVAQALTRSRIDAKIAALEEVVLDLPYLAGWSCVVLSNVSALALGETGQNALASYVRDLGGGLIVVGGDRAFSVGGYHRTPLEAVIPVETDRAKLNLLSLGLVIVLDRSGSMAGEKINMANQAAVASIGLLSRLDRIGVVAFDSAAEWVVPLARCENKSAILGRLGEITIGGGTDLYPALLAAWGALNATNDALKHIIVLTDGQSAPGDFDGISQRCGDAGITISTVAVGLDADRALLARIAQISGGRMYATDSARPLPQILVRETVLASRSGVFEGEFAPVFLSSVSEQVLRGFESEDFPSLRGYVVTALKPAAQAPLVRPREDGADPLLAYWQTGLGRTVAITTGMWPRWAPEWIEWPGFAKLLAQSVRYAARPAGSSDFRVAIHVDGETGKFVLEADEIGAALQSQITIRAQLVDPGFSARSLEFVRTAPGRFEAAFSIGDIGAYVVNATYSAGIDANRRTGSIQAGVLVTRSPEDAEIRGNQRLLSDLARRTGGRLLSLTHPEAVFEPWSVRGVETRQPMWEDLVRLAMLVFLLDVAVRRISIDPATTWKAVRTRVRELAGAGVNPTSEEMVAVLKDARRRARTGTGNPSQFSDAGTSTSGARPDSSEVRDAVSEMFIVGEQRATRRDEDRGAEPGEGDYAARLKRAKRGAIRDPMDFKYPNGPRGD